LKTIFIVSAAPHKTPIFAISTFRAEND